MITLHKRKHRRFALRYRIRGTFYFAGRVFKFDAITKNVSVGGLLLECCSRIPEHCPVTFTFRAQGGLVIHPVEFLGEGQVIRIEPDRLHRRFVIAVECFQPLECHPLRSRNHDMNRCVKTC